MAYRGNIVPVMIVSPSDVAAEREAVRAVIHEWNNIHSSGAGAALLPVGWDTHSSSELGKRGQDLINERLLRRSDLLVAVFRHRIGTPTGGYPSGSVEEIMKHIAAGKPAMVYFSDEAPPGDADQTQLKGLKEFRSWCYDNGLVWTFTSTDDLAAKFDRQLRIAIHENEYLRGIVLEANAGGVGSPSVSQRAPRPGSDLSAEARTILIEASKDDSGNAILQYAVVGGWGVQVGDRTLNGSNARSIAKFKEALATLESHGLIQALGTQREVFELTDAGFTLADSFTCPRAVISRHKFAAPDACAYRPRLAHQVT